MAHSIGLNKGCGKTQSSTRFAEKEARPHVLFLAPSNTGDAKVAILATTIIRPSFHLVAGRGCQSNALRLWLQIEHDRQIYHQHKVVEPMFYCIQNRCRVATREGHHIKTFMATMPSARHHAAMAFDAGFQKVVTEAGHLRWDRAKAFFFELHFHACGSFQLGDDRVATLDFAPRPHRPI